MIAAALAAKAHSTEAYVYVLFTVAFLILAFFAEDDGGDR